MLRVTIRITAWLSIFLLVGGCAKNPVTGKKELVLISESQEIGLGRSAHPEILREYGEVNNPELQAYLQEIGERLAADSHRPDLPWTFTVVDSPIINAFALPGGFIYFTRGILSYMNNEAELAGVLGHEIGHVTARHSVSQISKAQLFGLGLGLGSVFSPTFRQLGDLAQMGVGVLFLKYGRDAERQSDQLGIDYMHQAGYDPRELSDFFEVFQNLSAEREQSLPDWLSTHPAPPDRIQATSKRAEEVLRASASGELTVATSELLRKIDGILVGDNPREGFVEEGRFLHPDLRFQFDIPKGWRAVNTKSTVVLQEPNQGAVIQLTLAPSGQDKSPEQVGREFANQPGVEMISSTSKRVNGNPAFQALFEISRQDGLTLGVRADFIGYGGLIYELAGVSPADRYRSYSSQFESTLGSFRELTDRRALQVQPDRLALHRAKRGETLNRIAAQYQNPRAGAEELAVINRMEPDRPLQEGVLVKVVRPGRR